MSPLRRRQRATTPAEDTVSPEELASIEAALTAPDEVPPLPEVPVESLIPTGSTLLNLALSDYIYGGYIPGTVVNIVGDSSAGKTFLLWTMFAEMRHNSLFDEYVLKYDEPERAFQMNIPHLFGLQDGEIDCSCTSVTIQDFFRNIANSTTEDEPPCVYGVDSFDSLTSVEELERLAHLIKKGELKGTMDMIKQKTLGQLFRSSITDINRSRSLLVVISQVRDKIGVTFGETKTRSGGHALRFYSTHEIWLSVASHVKRKELDVGVEVRAKVKKNKFTGKLREVEFPIYYDYGVDDTTSCVRFLVETHKFSKGSSGRITSPQLGLTNLYETDFVTKLENNDMIEEMKQLVQEAWNEREEAARTVRRPKYGER